jgi:hypothetical protein
MVLVGVLSLQVLVSLILPLLHCVFHYVSDVLDSNIGLDSRNKTILVSSYNLGHLSVLKQSSIRHIDLAAVVPVVRLVGQLLK